MPAYSLTRFLHRLETAFDRWKYRKPGKRPRIQTFRGFGTDRDLFVRGRILQDLPIAPARLDDSLLKIFLDSFNRFESDEIPHARVRLSYPGITSEVQADAEGYFNAWLNLSPVRPAGEWIRQSTLLTILVELLEPQRPGQAPIQAEAQVVIPSNSCRFGIISDIDDTIIQTNVLSPWKLIFNLMFRTALTRRSFPGTSAFYRGLQQSQPKDPINPIFYVSTSPWNLYDLLEEYMAFQRFPSNPVMALRDWGLHQDEILPTEHSKHKLSYITQVLRLYDSMRFILIGDSSQQDPEIYTRLVERYSQRILGVYIREVTHNPQRIERVQQLKQRIAVKGVPLILAGNSLEMAEHAAAQGWISPQALAEVRADNKEGK
jgi:phosphatidate phosphatase APP1